MSYVKGMLEDISSALVDASNHVDERTEDLPSELQQDMKALETMLHTALQHVQGMLSKCTRTRERHEDDGLEYSDPRDKRDEVF